MHLSVLPFLPVFLFLYILLPPIGALMRTSNGELLYLIVGYCFFYLMHLLFGTTSDVGGFTYGDNGDNTVASHAAFVFLPEQVVASVAVEAAAAVGRSFLSATHC